MTVLTICVCMYFKIYMSVLYVCIYLHYVYICLCVQIYIYIFMCMHNVPTIYMCVHIGCVAFPREMWAKTNSPKRRHRLQTTEIIPPTTSCLVNQWVSLVYLQKCHWKTHHSMWWKLSPRSPLKDVQSTEEPPLSRILYSICNLREGCCLSGPPGLCEFCELLEFVNLPPPSRREQFNAEETAPR